MCARQGSFLGPTQNYGAPLSVIKPPDNNVASSRYHPSLMDPSLHLSEQQMRDLQDEIMGLYAVLQTGAALPNPPAN